MLKTLRRYVFLVIVAIVVPLAGIASTPREMKAVEKLRIEGVTNITHLSTSGMNLYVEVTNLSWHRLVLSRGVIDFEIDGTRVATISLRDKVVVKAHRTSEVLIPLRFDTRNLLVINNIVRRLSEGDTEDITISYDVRAGIPLLKRTFCDEEIAISEFLNNFALSEEVILQLNEHLN